MPKRAVASSITSESGGATPPAAVAALAAAEPGYYGWASLFAQTWMKVFTLVAFLAFIYHAWVGVRDIWMDYVKPLAIRLALQVFTILWLLGSFVWAVEVVWRV